MLQVGEQKYAVSCCRNVYWVFEVPISFVRIRHRRKINSFLNPQHNNNYTVISQTKLSRYSSLSNKIS